MNIDATNFINRAKTDGHCLSIWLTQTWSQPNPEKILFEGDLLVMWDSGSIYRSEPAKTLLDERLIRIHLERLPVYNPDSNQAQLI